MSDIEPKQPEYVDLDALFVHDHRPDGFTAEQVAQIAARVAFGKRPWWQRLVAPKPAGWPR